MFNYDGMKFAAVCNSMIDIYNVKTKKKIGHYSHIDIVSTLHMWILFHKKIIKYFKS